jgi:hypothetical protein
LRIRDPIKFQLFTSDGTKLGELTVKEVVKKDTVEGFVFIPMIMEETQWVKTDYKTARYTLTKARKRLRKLSRQLQSENMPRQRNTVGDDNCPESEDE